MSISDTLDGGPRGVPMRFTPPAQLAKIDLDESPELRMQRTYQQAATVLPNADPGELAHLALMQEVTVARLISEGAVYAAHCVARSEAEPATLCTAEFAILIQETDLPAAQPLATIANGLKEPGEPRATAFVQYPAGEALVVGEEVSITPSVLPSGRPNTRSYSMRLAQVIMPLPGRQRLATMSVSSYHLHDWPHFVRMLNDIAHSVRFSESDGTAISDRLGI